MKYSNRHISDEELDQLFRDAHAAEGQEPLFVPEFWSEMEAMLPEDKKSRVFLPWLSVAATVLLVLGLIFYPGENVEVSRLNAKQETLAKEEPKNTTDNTPIEQVTSENPGNESSTQDVPSESVTPAPRVQTHFRQRVRTNLQTPPVNRLQAAEQIREEINPETPEQKPLANTPSETKQDETGLNEDPNVDRLGTRELRESNNRDIEPLANLVNPEENSWYLELGATVGQSPYLSPSEKRNVVGGVVLGGGYTKKIDKAFVSLGVQARMEGFGGLDYRETNFSQNMTRTVSVKQLYSLEFPLRFGYVLKRSEISFGVVPGIQLFIHGREQIVQNQVIQREGNYTGKVEHSNSMSMEFGFQYYYHLTPKYSIGAKFQADVLRPFHTDYYLGKLAGLPLNGQIVLRRSFTK
ncbi:hypothetical protein [Fluviicola sp.]|uniref:hypothetical protein n=1 Tax=Fluviicola sp. TaxID=1917219 RepID=UPI0031CF104F